MYADRVDAQANRSIKERLDGNSSAGYGLRRNISGKRQREDDDKWEHDLFENNRPHVSNLRVGAKDLRLKLQKIIIGQSAQHVRGSASGGVIDLREKLSGTVYSRPNVSKTLRLNPKTASEASKPPRSNAIAEAPQRKLKKIASSVTKKKAPQKAETVDNFLESLGLEKYSITFQAEEVDMTALVHMSEEDLKAMGLPMEIRLKISYSYFQISDVLKSLEGPRKKILLGLESKV